MKTQPFTEIEAAAYLAAMIDGEGCVVMSINAKGKIQLRRIAITNTDLGILTACQEACGLLGITYKLVPRASYPSKGHLLAYDLNIHHRSNFEKIWEMVPIRSVRKQEKLLAIISSYQYKEYLPRTKPAKMRVLRAVS